MQNEVPTYDLVVANQAIFNFNETFLATLKSLHESCGYKNFMDKYLVYPPSGVQPPTFFNFSDDASAACDIYDMAIDAALSLNPCFDVYAIVSYSLLFRALVMKRGIVGCKR